MNFKVGDWVVFELKVGQVMEMKDGFHEFSDGFFRTSGTLAERFRPLTLKSKNIVETMDIIYKRLNHIDGEAGFNYPDISSYFAQLALDAIDRPDEAGQAFDKASEFVNEARDYKPIIQGIHLFRRSARRAS